jgi:hypothetical protein
MEPAAEYEVYDARNPTRTDGPYEDAKTAKEMAKNLNEFIHRNSSLGQVFPDAEVTGPYFVRPVTTKPARRLQVAVFDASADPHLTMGTVVR